MRPAKSDPKVRKIKEKADEAYAQQKWDKALELYQEVQAKTPYDVRIGQRVGDLFKRRGRPDDAVREYKRVTRHYAADGFWAKAIALSKLTLDLAPNDDEVRLQMAELVSKQSSSVPAKAVLPSDPIPVSIEAMSEASSPVLELSDVTDHSAQPIELTQEVESVNTPTSTLGEPLPVSAKIPLLSDLAPDELAAVLDRLAVRKFPPNGFVCEEGDIGQSMFIIAEGTVEVSVKDRDGTRLVVARLKGGEFFGEFSLLTGCERQATVQAKTELELLEITNVDFDIIAAKHPRIWSVLEDYLRCRVVETTLSKSEVFRALTKEEKEKLAPLLTHRHIAMDEIVIEEKTTGDEMYFVKTGALLVTVLRGADRIVIGELGPGDYFGEVAMLTGKPRTATVKAKSDCELFCLTRYAAAQVFKDNRDLLNLIRSKMSERAQEAVDAFRSYQELRSTLAFV